MHRKPFVSTPSTAGTAAPRPPPLAGRKAPRSEILGSEGVSNKGNYKRNAQRGCDSMGSFGTRLGSRCVGSANSSFRKRSDDGRNAYTSTVKKDPSPSELDRAADWHDPHDSVLKVFVVESEFNYGVPWSTCPQASTSGSAFVCKWNGRRLVLTNAHLIRNAALVELRKRGDHAKHLAEVACLGTECDLALLRLPDDSPFWDDSVGITLSSSLPGLGDEVTCVGYPTGGDNLCITQGVVSRIDMQAYPTSARELLVIQIDAAINAGNSGGPVLDAKGCCVGVAFQALKDSDNVGYIIPSQEVVEHFLKGFLLHGLHKGFGDFGFSLMSLENRNMRVSLGLSPDSDGAMVHLIHASTSASTVLRRWDVLCSVDGHRVGQDGKVPFGKKSRIDAGFLASRKFAGESCELEVVREGKLTQLTLELSRLEWLVTMDPPTPPEYFIIGGLVFTVLTEPYLRHRFGDDFVSSGPSRQVTLWMTYARKEFVEQQIVVLTQVLASSVTQGFTSLSNVILINFNDQPIRSLTHLISSVEMCKDKWLRFELEDEEVIVLPAEEAKNATRDILLCNAISHDRSLQHREGKPES